jgi:hypothetical protein
MHTLTHHQVKILKIVGVVILAIVCVASVVWFVYGYRELSQEGALQPAYTREGQGRVYHAMDVNDIQSWMTFNYINVVFKMPSSYMKNALGITDPAYPNIRIDTYAKKHNISLPAFMIGVRQGITSYLNSK